MTGDDVHLLLLLEARDLASGAIRALKGEIRGLTGSQMKHAAAFAATGFAAAGAAAEIGKFATSGVKQAINYQTEMVKLRTQARVSQSEYKTMYDYLLQQAPKLGVGPDLLSKALLRVESVGFRAKKSILGLHETAKGMINAVGKLQMVATGGKPGDFDIMGTAQVLNSMFTNKFKIDSSKGTAGFHSANAAAGALNKVAGLGDMTLPELLKALQIGLIPAASAAHIDARSTFAALETMTDVQIPAQRSATYLRQVISMIQGARSKPKTEGLLESLGMTGAALQQRASGPGGLLTAFQYLKSHLDKAGMHGIMTAKSIFDTGLIKEKGGKPVSQWVKADYTAAITYLENKLPDLSKAGKRSLAALLGTSSRTTSMHTALENVKGQIGAGPKDMGYADTVFNVLFGGARTGSGAAALFQNMGRFLGRYKQNASLDKASINPAAKLVDGSAQGQIAKWHATVQSLKIAVGTGFLPVLTLFLGAVNKLLAPLANWAAHHQKLAAIIVGGLFVFFSLVAVISLIGAVMVITEMSAVALGAALLPIIGIAALVTAGVVLLAVAAYLLITHWGGVKKFFVDLWHFLPGLFRAGWDMIKAAMWMGVYLSLLPLEYLARVAGKALGWIPGIGHSIKHATDRAVTFIESFRHKAAREMHKAGVDVRRGWDAGFGKHALAPELMSEHGGLGGSHNYSGGFLRPGPGGVHATAGPRKMSDPFGWAGKVPHAFVEGNKNMVKDFHATWTNITNDAHHYVGSLSGWLENQWNLTTEHDRQIWRDLRSWMTTLWGDLRSDAMDAWTDFGNWIGGLWTDIKNGVIDAFWDVVHWFAGLPGRIWNAISDGFNTAGSWASDIAGWVGDKIGDAASWIASKGSAAASGLWSALKTGIRDAASLAGQVGGWVAGKLGDAAGWIDQMGTTAATWLWNTLKSGIRDAPTILGVGGWVAGKLGDAAGWLGGTADKAVNGFWNYLTGEKGLQADASNLFTQAKIWIPKAVGDAGKWLWNLAQDAVTGFWNGLIHFFEHPGKFLGKIGTALVKMLEAIPGFHYLEKLFGSAGGNPDANGTAGKGPQPKRTPQGINDTFVDAAPSIVESLSATGAALQDVVSSLRSSGDGAIANHLARFGRAPEDGGNGSTVVLDFGGAQFMDDASLNRMMDRIGDHFTTKILPGAMQIRRGR